jgi:hypothetical protein
MNLKRLSKIGSRSFTALMAVWMSGFVLLLACNGQLSSSSTDHCPLAKLNSHCDSTDENKALVSLTNRDNDQTIDCCSFIPAFFDKTRRFDGRRSPLTTLAPDPVETPRSFIRVRPAEPVLIYRSVIPLGNKIFLKNRTFRI